MSNSNNIDYNKPEIKKVLFSRLMERYESIFVHLDPRKPGVEVPSKLRHQYQAVLQVGYDMPVPIPDLNADNVGITCTLSFRYVPFTCKLPWEAIFAFVGPDGMGITFDDAMPAELLNGGNVVHISQARQRKQIVRSRTEPVIVPPYLRLVK